MWYPSPPRLVLAAVGIGYFSKKFETPLSFPMHFTFSLYPTSAHIFSQVFSQGATAGGLCGGESLKNVWVSLTLDLHSITRDEGVLRLIRVYFNGTTVYLSYPIYTLNRSTDWCICCSSILSLVQFLFSFVLYSLPYIDIKKKKGK